MVMPPPAAIRSRMNDPAVALAVALKVSNEVPGGVRDCGENDAVTPEGKFETDSVTRLVKPSNGVNDTTKDAVSPGTRVSELGSMVKSKSCAVAAWMKATARNKIKRPAFFRRNIFLSLIHI